jgi:hypothetical protein
MTSLSKQARVGCKAWRQARLALLCQQARSSDEADGMGMGMGARGSSRRMAERLGIAPTALSNMIHGAKNIGDEAARSIESRLGLEPGLLDAPPLCLACHTPEELLAMEHALRLLRSGKAALA